MLQILTEQEQSMELSHLGSQSHSWASDHCALLSNHLGVRK